MSVDISRALEKSPEGYNALSWVLYIAAGVVLASHWVDITGVSLLIGGVIILVLASLRKGDAAGTNFQSHLSNISTVMFSYLIVAGILWVLTVGTLGLGIVITWPLAFLMLMWCVYRLIKGLMRLNDGASYS
jgi:uncharacterized membrane protein